LLGEVSLRCGDLEMAQRTVDEALALAARTGEKLYEAELYRLRGEIMLAKSGDASIDARDSAEQVFQSSLEVANQQDVKSLALRSAMSLARLWLRFGKPSKAREILAAVYESFSEGFGAADLREAASLLESGRLVAK
jgi:adenylate cyclase